MHKEIKKDSKMKTTTLKHISRETMGRTPTENNVFSIQGFLIQAMQVNQ